MPANSHLHKSMLLRGLKPPPAALDRSDIENMKNQAARSGRSWGGAPFRGNHGGGRGGRGSGPPHFSYAPPGRDRQQGPPVSQNGYGLPPGFNGHRPPPPPTGWQPPPPGHPNFGIGSAPPPPPHFSRGPPQSFGQESYSGPPQIREGPYGPSDHGSRHRGGYRGRGDRRNHSEQRGSGNQHFHRR